ncbi:MAG: extracellular solute-binding protein, partial [Acidimicrobiaceae bacterium]
FESDQYDELLTTGESVIAHGYSGNVVVSIDEYEGDDEYAYFVPSQGGTIWTDNMAVPFDAPHPCTAHAFINFILDADNGAQLSEWNYYASPNARSNEVMDPEVQEVLAVMYPDDLSGLEYITDTGDFETNFSDAFSEAKG